MRRGKLNREVGGRGGISFKYSRVLESAFKNGACLKVEEAILQTEYTLALPITQRDVT